MKRFILTLALALTLMVGLSACTASNNSSPGDPAPSKASGENSQSQVPSQDVVTGGNSGTEPVSAVSKGLLIAEHNPRSYVFNIYCLDPDTGYMSLFTSFTLPKWKDSTVELAYMAPRVFNRTSFSEDYSKMAVTQSDPIAVIVHAGWLDTQGNFFNVTEPLNLSDLAGNIGFVALGFANGYFGFGAVEGDYYVPLDDLNPGAAVEGDYMAVGRPFEEKNGVYGLLFNGSSIPKYKPSQVTCWLDDGRCIANTTDGESVIVDPRTGAETAYIPADGGRHHGGVISPDGTRIAYMSGASLVLAGSPTNVPLAPDIFVIPVDGGTPVQVIMKNCPFDLNSESTAYTLIDWI